MTAVPVVSTQLNTRTYKEFGGDFPHDAERVTAAPVFVVVDAAPDLTCRRCKGKGRKPGTPISGFRPQLHCTSCGGSGVSPVYAATWQWRYIASTKPTKWLSCTAPLDTPSIQRRQVVEWRATDVTVLPVVDDAVRTAIPDTTHIVAHRTGEVSIWTSAGPRSWHSSVMDEPWAADLCPGMCALRLDGWEHLEQPHTEMPGDSRNGCEHGSVPLSVPDGVLSWIELA